MPEPPNTSCELALISLNKQLYTRELRNTALAVSTLQHLLAVGHNAPQLGICAYTTSDSNNGDSPRTSIFLYVNGGGELIGWIML